MGQRIDRISQFISGLIEVGVRKLRASFPALTERDAREVMAQVAREMCHLYARTELYIPANLEQGLRNEEIRAQYAIDGPDGARKFSARRIDQLAAEHGLTSRRVRDIIGARSASPDESSRNA